MKLVLLTLATMVTLATSTTHAATGINAEYSPFVPKVITKLDAVKERRMAKAVLDCSASGACAIGAHSLGVQLPANALLTQSYYYSVVQPVSAGSGTIALSCEDANNILTAANLTSKTVGSISAGNQTGVASTMTAGISSACNITATVASSDYTAGKLDVYVEYVVHE